MKKLFVMMGLVMVSMTATTVFADDTSMTPGGQMNNQMQQSMPSDNGSSMPAEGGSLPTDNGMSQDMNSPANNSPTDSSMQGQSSSTDMGTSSKY